MGGGPSKGGGAVLTESQIRKLVKQTGFSPSEIEYLFRRFRMLCSEGDNLSKQCLEQNPHLLANPYVKRVFTVMPKNEVGDVTFADFVKTASIFRPEKPITPKLEFIFNLYDYNMDDTLDEEELSEMIGNIRPDLNDSEKDEMVKKTVNDILTKGGKVHKDGRIHCYNFVNYAKELPGIEDMLKLDLTDQLA